LRKKAKKKETLAATAAEIIAAFVGEDLDDDDDAELNEISPHEAITSNGHFAKASSCVYEGRRLHGFGSPEHV
tara:strand:- start:26 stop:244 length:219 start_codon:yes stop_codon:yes gene_type:complete